MKKSGIAKVVHIIKLDEQTSDVAFWRAQPPSARLSALEEIRQEYHRWKYGTEPRFERVCKIIKRKENKKATGRLQGLADLENLK